MANKLKDIFSDKMFDLGGTISFDNPEAHKKFLDALQIVWNEGKAVEIGGVSSIATEFKNGDINYPYSLHENITQVTVFPSKESAPFTVNTEFGKKTIAFKRYHTNSGMILETDQNEIVYFKLTFINGSSNITFHYKTQPLLAKAVTEIIEGYSAAKALLDTLFKSSEQQDTSDKATRINDARIFFENSISFFKRVHSLETELQISFNPADADNSRSDEEEIEELYLLLVEKKAIRLNAKLTSTEATGIKMIPKEKMLEIGSNLAMTFISNSDYILYGKKFSICTANFLSNAIIKEVVEQKDGTTKFLYGDTDSKPMYISYTGFKSEEEANQEMNVMMEHKEKYVDAKTLYEHLKNAQGR